MNREPSGNKRLAEAFEALRSEPAHLDVHRKARLRRSLHRRLSRQSKAAPWLLRASALAFAAALALLVVRLATLASTRDIDSRSHSTGASTASAHPTDAPAAAKPQLEWSKAPTDLAVRQTTDETILRFTTGSGTFIAPGVSPPTGLRVETPLASVAAVSAEFQVDATEVRVEVRVRIGKATVRTLKGGLPHTVKAGEVWTAEGSRPSKKTTFVPPPRRPKPGKDAASVPPPRSPQLPRTSVPRPRSVMEAADRARREGLLRRAARLYRQVHQNVWGGAYREEAVLREAEMLVAMGKESQAIAVLKGTLDLFTDGPLAPERRALLASLVKRTPSQ